MIDRIRDCNNCGVDPCKRKESKKVTKFFGIYVLSCPRHRRLEPLKRNMVEMAIWHEFTTFGYVKNISQVQGLF